MNSRTKHAINQKMKTNIFGRFLKKVFKFEFEFEFEFRNEWMFWFVEMMIESINFYFGTKV